MKIEIRSRWNREKILYSTEVADDDPQPMRTALERLAMCGLQADLLRDLRQITVEKLDVDVDEAEHQQLRYRIESIDRELGSPSDGARLDGASLDGASLVGARLDGARLDGASLVGARLDGASLDGARLDRASLVGARLDGARLDRASLDGASLDGASLDGLGELTEDKTEPARKDLRRILDASPNEVAGLLAAIRAGQVDGSTYSGPCACLVGTIARLRGCHYNRLDGIEPDSTCPAERWFLAIRPGHVPAISRVAALTERWILDWQAEQAAASEPKADPAP